MKVRFIGTHLNKVDGKGRVSVPAPFRSMIERDSENGRRFFYRPDPERPALECFTVGLWDKVDDLIEEKALDDADRELRQYQWYGTSSEIDCDNEGRIVLPRQHAEALGLQGQVQFVGYGERFKIWNPDRLAEYHDSLKAARDGGDAGGGGSGAAG